MSHNIQHTSSQDPDVIILGAGPVGLWTAINILKAHPDMHVTLFERHQTYIRANMIKICDPREVGVTSDSPLCKIFANELVSILDVENTLLKEAKALGATIQYEMVDGMESLFDRYPNTKRFIACDGAHSKTRTTFYGRTVDNTTYFNCIQVTFDVNTPKKLSEKQKQVLIDELGMIVEETILEKNKICLRFFANDEMFDSVKKFVFRTPCDNLKKITNENLQNAINLWFKARIHYLNDEIIESSFRLLTFKLGTYKASRFCHKDEHGRIVALCGDSAFGVPFYRSMRNGWVEANLMTELLFDEDFVEKYNKEMERLYFNEKFRADVIKDNLFIIGIFNNIRSKVDKAIKIEVDQIENVELKFFQELKIQA